MNRKRKLKQMRRFINRYGYIEHEYKRPPEKGFYPYRKGSFLSPLILMNSDLVELMEIAVSMKCTK